VSRNSDAVREGSAEFDNPMVGFAINDGLTPSGCSPTGDLGLRGTSGKEFHANARICG
jgi:hypothetical protein